MELYEEENEIITELRNLVRPQVKNEIKLLEDKNKALKKENIELKQKVANLDKLEEELKEKIENAKQDFYYEKIGNLIDYIPNTRNIFHISRTYENASKCNCCDENRKITFTDSLGREYKVNCQCSNEKLTYFYEKSDIKEMELYKDNASLRLCLNVCWDIYGSQSICIYYKDKGMIIEKFDENNPPEDWRKALFTDENEAKKYVDWLNKKEEKENK